MQKCPIRTVPNNRMSYFLLSVFFFYKRNQIQYQVEVELQYKIDFMMMRVGLVIFGFFVSLYCGSVSNLKLTLIGPRQANLVLIVYASSEGSGETARMRRLA